MNQEIEDGIIYRLQICVEINTINSLDEIDEFKMLVKLYEQGAHDRLVISQLPDLPVIS